MLTLAVVLAHGARQHPDRVAVVADELHMTHAQVDEAANRSPRTGSGQQPGQ
jgi:non-ribosomal peptide synthetase component E (peptide arylation enzyme)